MQGYFKGRNVKGAFCSKKECETYSKEQIMLSQSKKDLIHASCHLTASCT